MKENSSLVDKVMTDELSDGRILIRPFREDDIDVVFEAVRESVTEVSPWLPWCHANYKRDETVAFILSRPEAWSTGQEYAFAVVDAGTNAFLGGVGLSQINYIHRICNLGYWVRTSCVRRGTASAAARLAARFGLQQLGLQRIEILAAVGNHASQRVAEKAGATREGVLCKRLLVNGQSQDAVLYSLVAEDIAE